MGCATSSLSLMDHNSSSSSSRNNTIINQNIQNNINNNNNNQTFDDALATAIVPAANESPKATAATTPTPTHDDETSTANSEPFGLCDDAEVNLVVRTQFYAAGVMAVDDDDVFERSVDSHGTAGLSHASSMSITGSPLLVPDERHDHQQQDQEEGDGSTGTAYFDPGAAADTLWAAHYDVPRGWSMRVPKEQGWATNNNNNNIGDDDSPVHLTTFTSPCSCASAHVRVMRVPWQLATSPGSVRDQVLAIPGVVPSSVVLVDNRVTNYNNATNHRRDPDAPRATIRYVVIQKQQQQREKTKKQRRPRDGDIDDNNPLLSPTTLAHEDDKDNNDDDMRVEGLRVVAPRGDRLYDVTLRAPESEWLRMGPTLRAMENSFMLRYGR
eukprot:PhM_4_TR17422/c2_g1_i2/m.78010